MGARTVLVTGANSGIGLATAIELASRGFDAVGSVRSAAKGRVVSAAARRAGVRVRTVQLDVTDAAACRRVIDRVRPWGLVNNAGFGAVGAIEDIEEPVARQALETMVMAPMRLARLALPHMREAGGGRIVNLSSIYGRTSTPLTGWYQGSKHALEALSDALRMEVARSGIKVILIEPGGFDTGIWESSNVHMAMPAGSSYEGAYRRVRQGIALSRPLMGKPDQVARVIRKALTSRRPSSRYLVGLDAQAIAIYEQLTPTVIKDLVSRTGLGL